MNNMYGKDKFHDRQKAVLQKSAQKIENDSGWAQNNFMREYAEEIFPASGAELSFGELCAIGERVEQEAAFSAKEAMRNKIKERRDSKHLFTQRTINGKVYELPFEAESDGTKKMIAALPVLMVALQEGRTVVVDELDAKLHPKLLRYVIQMFKNQELNKKGAQLLFSSHDLTTMKNTVFRRDEIWFAAMNDNHESEIYSLYEFRQEDNTRVKSTAAFDKQYLEGRYGADPYLSNMLTGRDWA